MHAPRRDEKAGVKFEPVGERAAALVRRRGKWAMLLVGVFLGAILCVAVQAMQHWLTHRVSFWRQTPSPSRLRIVGKHIYLPDQAEPSILRGVDLMFKYGTAEMDGVTRQDRMLPNLIPGVSLLRLIINHWADDVTTSVGADCYDESAEDFLRPACLAMFDEVVQWATNEAGYWVIITARSALAAGDGGVGRTIFDNSTLRTHWMTMWGALARRYAKTERIAGFEVMSEPRTYASASVVHEAQQLACTAVFQNNPGAACVVGPARFYDRFQLNKTYIISGGPTLYAANFFAPRSWVSTHIDSNNPNASYPGDFACCDLYQKDREHRRSVCGGSEASACAGAPRVHANRFWMEDQLRNVLSFRDSFDVPVWIDQWGVRADAVGGAEAQDAYLSDILSIFERERLHWTYWIWRRISKPPDWTCGGFAVICQSEQGNYFIQERLLNHLSRAVGSSTSNKERPKSRHTRNSIQVDVGAQPHHKLSPFLHSIFYESEINFAGSGGLYAELIRNRDFEALGRGCVEDCPSSPSWFLPPLESIDGRDPHEPAVIKDDFRPWRPVGAARLRIDNASAPFATNPHSLRVDCSAGSTGEYGVRNPGYWGIACAPPVGLKLIFYARTVNNKPLELIARLMQDGKLLAEAGVKRVAGTSPTKLQPSDGWVEYHALLMPLLGTTAGEIEILAKDCSQQVTFWLDGVSLMPTDAIAGLFRRDLFVKLREMRPGFIRLPGGNYLEGFGLRTRWNWKDTLGHWAARSGHYNVRIAAFPSSCTCALHSCLCCPFT